MDDPGQLEAQKKETIVFSPWLFGKNPKRTLVRLGVLIGIFFITFKFFLVPVRVTGDSMAVSYKNGEINFVLRTAYSEEKKPQRGDVVAVWLDTRGLCFLKRVIALPGEQMGILNGEVLIDGKPIPEPYVWEKRPWFQRPITLKDNEYYLIGDNRSMYIFEHEHGVVYEREIMGKVIVGDLKDFDYNQYLLDERLLESKKKKHESGE